MLVVRRTRMIVLRTLCWVAAWRSHWSQQSVVRVSELPLLWLSVVVGVTAATGQLTTTCLSQCRGYNSPTVARFQMWTVCYQICKLHCKGHLWVSFEGRKFSDLTDRNCCFFTSRHCAGVVLCGICCCRVSVRPSVRHKLVLYRNG